MFTFKVISHAVSPKTWSGLRLVKVYRRVIMPFSIPCDDPLYPEEMDIKTFEERQDEDIRDLRAQYQQAVAERSADHPDAKKIAARIHYIRNSLSRDLLRRRRAEWFNDSDRLRATGKLVIKAPGHDLNPFKTFDPNGALAAEAISEFMQDESEYEKGAIKLVNVYLAHLRRRPAEVSALLDTNDKETKNEPCTQIDDDAETVHGHARAPDLPIGLASRLSILERNVNYI
ncbi:hypothetical protein F4804DRAFT_202969 [Jackrogersella minutella]|nr:hypothetical protein F4804DRAFT_202969 [Jackrogersella minutella]